MGICALALLLYALLTGVLPFDRKTMRGSSLEEVRRAYAGRQFVTPAAQLLAAAILERWETGDRQP